MKITTLNRCWKKIRPAVVAVENVHESKENEIGGILELVTSNMNMAIDLYDLLAGQGVGKADLVEIASEPQVNEIDSSSEDSEVNNLTLKKITGRIGLAQKLELLFLNAADPCAERSRKFKGKLQKCLSPYQEI